MKKKDIPKKEKTQKITILEDELYDDHEIKEECLQLVVFRLANEWYGVEISRVREVIKVEGLTFLPSSPEYIAGIVNLRGNILSVTDLKNIFGLARHELTEQSRLVIVESGILETGLLVDEVIEIEEVPLSKIDPTLTTIAPEKAEYFEGECKIGDKLIGILKVEKAFMR